MVTKQDDKESLIEKIVGSENMERLTNSPIYKYAVDTAAMISFSTPIAMTNEIFIAGMTPLQSLKARGIATLVNMATARPYGKFRDYIFKKFKTTEDSGFFKKYITDVTAFATFQAPLYAGILVASGADAKQIAVGSATITALSGLIGRPYGAYSDALRKFCGLKPAYDLNQEQINEKLENSLKEK